MFNKDFYPTPPDVIEQMLADTNVSGKHVLEPSAGKGNIVDYLKAHGAEVIACELNPDLATIVASKCRLLKPDFLQLTREDISHVNLIVMNPPFSADEQHINHAWEIAPDGCEIVALCNWETYSNAYTWQRRQLRSTVNDYGVAINLGDVFSDAERTTGIEIGLVRLFKPGNATNFDGYFDYEPDEAEAQANGIMPYNAVREIVNRYVEACRQYNQVAAAAATLNYIAGPIGTGDLALSIKQGEEEVSAQRFRIEMQKRAWRYVFSKMNMDKYVTGKLKEEINKFVETQQRVPFTMRNVYKMLQMIVGTHGERMTKELIRVFDDVTARHDDNRYNLEGWKTNSHYMLNKKFIISWGTESDWSGKPRPGQYSRERLSDLTKALCFVTGTNYDALNLPDFYSDHWKTVSQWGQWVEYGFLDIRMYRKGSIHARFRDLKVWELFNRTVAKAKGYPLPEKL